MADTTAKHALPFAEGSDLINTLDGTMEDLATTLDGIIATDDQGSLASRPVSTPGSPGKEGRYYWATDSSQLFRDYGTGWTEIRVGATAPPQSPEANLKIITGSINADGTIADGVGFTVVKGSTGVYQVLFTDDFASVPRVQLTPIVSASARVPGVTTRLAGSITLQLWTLGGSAVDSAFMFDATGPAQ